MSLSREQLSGYREDGYLRLPGHFAAEEVESLGRFLCEDPDGINLFRTVGPLDYIGWTDPADDLVGRLSRMSRVVTAAETLIGEPCYHYHTKVVRKPAHRQGRLEWHQDFASWYKDGCLAPSMVTVVLALTPSNRANGCLQMMKGSYRMGRLDRMRDGHESYSYFSLYEPRLKAVKQRFKVEPIEMAPGDVFIFHANTLHASGPNQTDGPRILLEITYNACTNPPVFAGQDHHAVRPLQSAPDTGARDRTYPSLLGHTRLVDIDNPDDPGVQLFRRRYDPGLC